MAFAERAASYRQSVSAPETLGQFFALIFREGVRALRRRILSTIAIFFLGWIIHTFLLVGPNDGFGRNYTLLSDFLATSGNTIGGTLIWTLVPALVVAGINRVRGVGSAGYFDGFKRGLAWARESYRRLGEQALPILLGGAAVALGIVALFRNNLLGLVLSGSMVSALGAQSESIWFLFLRVAWNDVRRRGKSQKPFDMAKACVGTAGAALGFLAGFILPGMRSHGLFGFIGALILVGVAVVLYLSRKKGQQPPAMLVLAMALALTALWTVALPAYAHDGGLKEAGGTWSDWVKSEGAAKAVAGGIAPAVAGAIGGAIGAALSSISLGGPPTLQQVVQPTKPTPPPWHARVPKEDNIYDDQKARDKIREIDKSILTDLQNLNPLDSDFWDKKNQLLDKIPTRVRNGKRVKSIAIDWLEDEDGNFVLDKDGKPILDDNIVIVVEEPVHKRPVPPTPPPPTPPPPTPPPPTPPPPTPPPPTPPPPTPPPPTPPPPTPPPPTPPPPTPPPPTPPPPRPRKRSPIEELDDRRLEELKELKARELPLEDLARDLRRQREALKRNRKNNSISGFSDCGVDVAFMWLSVITQAFPEGKVDGIMKKLFEPPHAEQWKNTITAYLQGTWKRILKQGAKTAGGAPPPNGWELLLDVYVGPLKAVEAAKKVGLAKEEELPPGKYPGMQLYIDHFSPPDVEKLVLDLVPGGVPKAVIQDFLEWVKRKDAAKLLGILEDFWSFGKTLHRARAISMYKTMRIRLLNARLITINSSLDWIRQDIEVLEKARREVGVGLDLV